MAHFHNNALIGAAGAGGAAEFRVERSLRFNSGDSAYLNRTPSSAGNRRTFTWSGWVKRSGLGAQSDFFSAGNSSDYLRVGGFNSSDKLELRSDSAVVHVVTEQVFRDVAAWYHIVIAVDTTQSTSSNRVKFYVNGSQITNFSTSSYPSQNRQEAVNDTGEHRVGAFIDKTSATVYYPFNGYLADVHFIDGQALAASDFGETDDNSNWNPKEYSGSYGTNGFYLKFADNSSTSDLGNDSAGSNNWTANNFSVASGEGNDSLLDTPMNYEADSGNNGGNYCVWNPLSSNGGVTIKNGNLDTVNTGSSYDNPRATFGMSSGKWYWEVKLTSFAGGFHVGLALPNAANSSYLGATSGTWAYGDSGQKYDQGSSSSYGASFTSVGDVISCAFDADAGSVVFYKNGVSQGTAFTGLTNGPYLPALYARVNSTGGSWNFGQRPFTYTPPSNHKALCTTNLTDPTIADGSDHFDAKIYTGVETANTNITGFNFSPDWVWLKKRNGDISHFLYDTIRGVRRSFYSDRTEAENNYSDTLESFNSDGFTLGDSGFINSNNDTYVAWCWDAGSSTVSNTNGSVTSTVRANTTAGFSIVKYTGNGTNATIGHGLNAAPKLIFLKGDTTVNWVVFHKDVPNNKFLELSSSGGPYTNPDVWRSTNPTSSVFSIHSNFNASSTDYYAYCFAPVEGYSTFGSYTGTNNANGPFIFTGFRPAWLLIKRSNGSSNWYLVDNARDPDNDVHKYLKPNANSAEIDTNSEGTKNNLDFLSNGFKLRGTEISTNASQDYVYAAFAENPFKTARAR